MWKVNGVANFIFGGRVEKVKEQKKKILWQREKEEENDTKG